VRPRSKSLNLGIVFVLFIAQVGITKSQAADSLGVRPASELAIASISNVSSIPNPSNQPDNLVSLASQISKSVVTVVCGNYQGSGWSINVRFTDNMITAGFKSYVITNHHVVKTCTSGNLVELTLNNQAKGAGIVWAWDDDADLAAIVTTATIPGLKWQGALPLQGQWAGVIGSPRGIPGLLSTGILSAVNGAGGTGMLTAPINPGNSGGPVFDRTGTVVGVATAKYFGSEGMGIFQGTPFLCKAIINCPSGTNAWYGQTISTELFGKNPIRLNENALSFQSFTDSDLKGVLYCATTPDLSEQLVSQYQISGMRWRITDLSNQKILEDFEFKLHSNSVSTPYNEDLPNGKKIVTIAGSSGVIAYAYALKNQVKNVNYECGVSFVAKNLIGEFTSKVVKSETDTRDFKPYVPIVSKVKIITCTKGSIKKTIKGTNPKCPSGYKRT
jgi:S1-C subfamily serine protease